MAKKKLNPDRVPVKPNSVSIPDLVNKATQGMVLRAWALILSSYANFSEASTQSITELWKQANAHAEKFGTMKDVQSELDYVERLTGRKIPFEVVNPPAGGFRTQGDVNRFKRKLEKNAVYAAFAVIVDPVARGGILTEEDARILFRRALLTNEQIDDKSVSVDDLLLILKEEYNIELYDENDVVKLRLVDNV